MLLAGLEVDPQFDFKRCYFYEINTYFISLLFDFLQGDCTINYYEVTEEDPYVFFLNAYKSTEPQRGIGMMPKRGVNVNQCEIAR